MKAVVDSLSKSTREMRETNKALEERLTLSKSEISDLIWPSATSAKAIVRSCSSSTLTTDRIPIAGQTARTQQ